MNKEDWHMSRSPLAQNSLWDNDTAAVDRKGGRHQEATSCGRSIPVHLPSRDMLRHELIGAWFVRGELPSVCDLAQGFPERWPWVVQY